MVAGETHSTVGGHVPNSKELGFEDCRRLLSGGVVGRLAVSTSDGPLIVPLNYSYMGDAVVLQTDPASVVGRTDPGTVVAFEVDHFDHEYHRGWSVLARGPLRAVIDPEELDQIRAVRPVRPWVDGPRDLCLRIEVTDLTGRRLGDGWTSQTELPVRRTS